MPQSVYVNAEKARRAKKTAPHHGDGGPILLNKQHCKVHTARFNSIIADERAACYTEFTNPTLPLVSGFALMLVQEGEAVSGALSVARNIIGARGCAEYMA